MRLLHKLEEIEEAWAQYRGPQASPYQSLAWYRQWLENVSIGRGEAPLAAVWHDEQGQPLMLLPLVSMTHYGFRIAMFAGGKHSNCNMPILARQADILTSSFDRSALRSAGLDAIILKAMPRYLLNQPNPFLRKGGWKHTADRFVLNLASSGPLTGGYGKRQEKRRKRAQQVFEYASTDNTLSSGDILRAFSEQRRTWSSARSVPDVFADPLIMNFFDRLHLDNESGMRLHCLTANDHIVAVAATLRHHTTEALMFVSYERESKIAKLSPGLFLVQEVTYQAQRDGMTLFDFGLGAAEYKERLGAEQVDMYSMGYGVSVLGRLFCQVVALAECMKRYLKHYPGLVRFFQKVIAFGRR